MSNPTKPGYEYVVGELLLKPDGGRDLVDEHGKPWLYVGKTGLCEEMDGTFYADRNGTVFRAWPEPHCERTETLSVCGSIPVDGCGAPPPEDERLEWSVQAPDGATFLDGEPVRLQYRVPICYELKPREGFDHPP